MCASAEEERHCIGGIRGDSSPIAIGVGDASPHPLGDVVFCPPALRAVAGQCRKR
jgi:hypothetical protein